MKIRAQTRVHKKQTRKTILTPLASCFFSNQNPNVKQGEIFNAKCTFVGI